MIDPYPPNLPAERIKELETISLDWAAANGLIVRQNHVVHAPFALFPSPFPRKCYELAKQIQPLFNALVDEVARDKEFIDGIMTSLASSDEFTHRVYQIYLNHKSTQNVWMGIHRSDYLLHVENKEPTIKQVELNTIAASFSSLSSKTDQLHRYLGKRTDFFNQEAPQYLDIKLEQFPENKSGVSIADGLAKACKLYGVNRSAVMMVVQPGENNVFDQRWIEQTLFERYQVIN